MPATRTKARGRTDGLDRDHLIAFDRAALVALQDAINIKANRKPLLDHRRTLLYSASKIIDRELGEQPGDEVAIVLRWVEWDRIKTECRSIGQHEVADVIAGVLCSEQGGD